MATDTNGIKGQKGQKCQNAMSYYVCVNCGCAGTAATVDEISDKHINLKYHNLPHKQHNHPPDIANNLNAEVLHKFRAAAKSNPDQQGQYNIWGRPLKHEIRA